MNDSYTDAIKEVATQAPIDNAMIETLGISHPDGGSVNIVNSRESFVGYASPTISNLNKVFYKPASFNMKLPESNKDGVSYLSVAFPNADGQASDFLDKVPVESDYPITLIYRIYLANDLKNEARPQNDPVLKLQVLNVEINPFEVQIKCSFRSIINTKYPSERYTLEKFPAIAN